MSIYKGGVKKGTFEIFTILKGSQVAAKLLLIILSNLYYVLLLI